MANLRKEIFPKWEYNKLKLKNIGPCRILGKFSANSYELELLVDVGVSLIFNVADLYLYNGDRVYSSTKSLEDIEEQTNIWK